MVDSGIGEGASPACAPTGAGTCGFTVTFALSGLPADGVYAVAARSLSPPSEWSVLPREDLDIAPGPVIDAAVMLPADTELAQVAVLVFPDGSVRAPSGPTETLTATGAGDIFVTQTFPVQ